MVRGVSCSLLKPPTGPNDMMYGVVMSSCTQPSLTGIIDMMCMCALDACIATSAYMHHLTGYGYKPLGAEIGYHIGCLSIQSNSKSLLPLPTFSLPRRLLLTLKLHCSAKII